MLGAFLKKENTKIDKQLTLQFQKFVATNNNISQFNMLFNNTSNVFICHIHKIMRDYLLPHSKQLQFSEHLILF